MRGTVTGSLRLTDLNNHLAKPLPVHIVDLGGSAAQINNKILLSRTHKEAKLADGTIAYVSDGAPSDRVALALLGFFEHKFDLVVSGIHPMPNLEHKDCVNENFTYKGR